MARGVPIVLLAVAVLAPIAQAAAGPKEDVAAATRAWADAFNSREPDRVLALYDPEAVLWGTVSPTIRDTRDAIRDYFKDMPNQPQARIAIGDQRIRVYGDTAINSGYYTLSNVRDGQPVTIPLRFSFVYRKQDGRWMIVDHHSSPIPAPRR